MGAELALKGGVVVAGGAAGAKYVADRRMPGTPDEYEPEMSQRSGASRSGAAFTPAQDRVTPDRGEQLPRG
jgi:hypothetical protein